MTFLLPIDRLRETGTLLAFHHPRPSYPVHILLVPKRAVATLADLTPADAGFLTDLFQTVASLVHEFGLEEDGYRLITNGGAYQDVPQLHFHLISGTGEQGEV
jgi:histidine triad (HIT) family protein